MDLFIGTVAASAEATTYPDSNTLAAVADDKPEPRIADYMRPTAVQSEYLATAVKPAPWPSRDAPPERGGRPLLGPERKIFRTASGR